LVVLLLLLLLIVMWLEALQICTAATTPVLSPLLPAVLANCGPGRRANIYSSVIMTASPNRNPFGPGGPLLLGRLMLLLPLLLLLSSGSWCRSCCSLLMHSTAACTVSLMVTSDTAGA
jgi:hypothetical protein